MTGDPYLCPACEAEIDHPGATCTACGYSSEAAPADDVALNEWEKTIPDAPEGGEG